MKSRKISFDWDNTIVMSYMVDSSYPSKDTGLPIYQFQEYNEELIRKIKEYHAAGDELYIVTSRKRSLEEYYPEESVAYHIEMLKLSHIFPPVWKR